MNVDASFCCDMKTVRQSLLSKRIDFLSFYVSKGNCQFYKFKIIKCKVSEMNKIPKKKIIFHNRRSVKRRA